MGPLISEGLLVEIEGAGDKRGEAWYEITGKGERMLEYLGLAFSLIKLENKYN
jgi:hypothetical protein